MPPSAHAMQHLRDLRSLYDNAFCGKQAYHTVLSIHMRDQIHITRTHHFLPQHVSEMTDVYYAVKRATLTLYTESATLMGLYKWYQIHREKLQELTDARRSYTQHLLCHALDWAYRQRLETLIPDDAHTLQHRITTNMTATVYTP